MAQTTDNIKNKRNTVTEEPTAGIKNEQAKALEVAFAQIDKRFGKGTVMMLGQKPKVAVDVVPTGSMALNEALGVGGFPRGRIVEVFGPEASGKTTIALHAIAQMQAMGGVCAFIDAEHALDPAYATSLGVNLDSLVISQPDYGEQALDIAEMLVRSGAIDLVVVDSVAALVPKAEIEGDMGDIHVGLQARLMSQALRKLTPIINKSKSVLLFINQIRHKINAMAFANKETTSGGNALKFYASVRLDVRKISSIKKGEDMIGNRVLIKVVKNKVAPPFAKVELDLIFGKGICQNREIAELAIELGVIKQSGAWFSYEGEKVCQGKDALFDKMDKDQDFFKKVYSKVKNDTTTGADSGNEEAFD